MDISQKRRKPLAWSITFRVSALFFGAMILVVIAASILSYVMASRDANIIINDKLDYYVQTLDEWMNARAGQLYVTRDMLENLDDTEAEESLDNKIKSILVKSALYGEEFNIIADYVIFDKDGKVISSDGWIPDPDYDARDYEYYQIPFTTGKLYIEGPYIDVDTLDEIVTFSIPFYMQGKPAGILCRDFTTNALSDIFSSYKSEDNSHVFLMTSKGDILSHKNADFMPNAEEIINAHNISNNEFFTKTREDKSVSIRDYDGSGAIAKVKTSAVTGWTVGISYPQSNLVFSVILTIIIIFATYIFVTLGTNLLVWNLVNRKVNPVKDLITAAKQLEQGDFNIKLVPKRNDEIGDVIVAVNSTGKYLRTMIDELKRVLHLLAIGDLTVKSNADYRGDFIEVKDSIHTIVNGVRRLLSEIAGLVEIVTSSSMQVSERSNSLSASVNNQSKQIDDIKSSIESISEVIRLNVDECNDASKHTIDVSEKLMQSNEHMNHMVSAMKDITDTSDQIKKISKTIEDMAMQTNILSINAAVEASHAGIHGKGFAVVAEEVNSFANQCSDAAQSTTTLVDGSIRAVNKGSTLANETAESLKSVVGLAQTVVSEIEKIVNLSVHQEEEINAISLYVNNIASSINEDIASAEEGASTSEELSAQAQVMLETIKKFKM